MTASAQTLLAWSALVLAAPILPGIATKTRAYLTGRRGPPVWQLYVDLWKLWRRGAVYSRTTSPIFRLAPITVLVTTFLATSLVPVDGQRALYSFSGDLVAFAYLLALGRFLMVLGALDTGSSFEGMGASREVTLASMVEPGLFVSLAALAVATHQLTLTGMLGGGLWQHWRPIAPALLLVAGSLFVLMLAECARAPVDDPTTHLELTMIHEVMILDHSGPDLAMLLYASALKLGVFSTLIVLLVLPFGAGSSWIALARIPIGLVGVGVGVGFVEATTARLRLVKVPLYIAGGAALGFFGLVLLLQ